MGEFLSADLPLRTVQELVLSKDTLKRAGDFRFDVVTRSSLASTTFAKGYGVKGHFRGSGPVVLLDAATLQPAQHDPHLLASGVAGSAARGALGHGAAGELAPKRACLTTPRQGTDDHRPQSETGGLDPPTPAISEGPMSEQRVFRAVSSDEVVRLFSADEMLRLHGFPRTFVFPADVTQKQGRALVGNSVNVDVIAHLLQVLLADTCWK